MEELEPHQLVMAAEAVQLLGLNEQAKYLIELAYLGFDAADDRNQSAGFRFDSDVD